jgi:predicted nuclease with RNAse H fold
MFAVTAAREVMERNASQVARLRSAGVLVLETTPAAVKAAALNEYLTVKARGLL